MRKTITRTLIRTTAPVYRVTMNNGVPATEELEPVNVWGKTTQAEMMKVARKTHGEGNYVLGNIEQVEETYRIGINEFVAAAVKVENEEENQEDEE